MRPQYGIPAFEGTTYTPDDFERMRPRSFEDSARPVDSYEWLGATPESMPIDARVQQQQEADALAKQANAKKTIKSGFGKAKEALNRPVFQSRGQTDINYDPRYADRLGQMMVLSDENSKQRIQDLEGELTNMYAALGGEQAGQRRPGGDFSQVGSYSYEYKDPGAQGAAPGSQAGPMADELRGLPGVVKPGPDGFDRVDPARLSLTNASATGELAREVEALRKDVATLGGNPDAVLSRVNKPASARQGTTIVEEPSAQPFGGPAARNFGPRAEDQFVTRPESESDLNVPVLSPAERYQLALEKQYGEGDIAPGGAADPRMMRPPSQLEYNNRSTERQSVGRVEDTWRQNWREGQARKASQAAPGSPEWYRATQSARAPVDADERARQELLRESEALYGAEKYRKGRNAAIDEYMRDIDSASPSGRTHASPQQIMQEFNIDPNGEVVGDFSQQEIDAALRRREELYL